MPQEGKNGMRLRSRRMGSLVALAVVALVGSAAIGEPAAFAGQSPHPAGAAAVYTRTNAAGDNEGLAFREDATGTLNLIGRYPTGGAGSGDALGSQGAVTLSEQEDMLFVVNAGSDTVSAFAVASDGSLTGRGAVPSGGDRPISVTVRDGFGYALN